MLDDLTPQELTMLGHALRMVPGNACLVGTSLTQLGGSGVGFFHEIPAYQSLWNKVAEAIRARPDMEPYRG